MPSRAPITPCATRVTVSAQQAGIVVEPLDVAAEPVEIVGDAALQVGAAAIDRELVEAAVGRDLHVGRVLGQHPDVLQRAVQPAELASAVSPAGSRASPPGSTR